MDRAERERIERRTRLALAWFLTALVVGIYVLLPGGGGSPSFTRAPADATETPLGVRSLEIVEVTPPDASPGRAVTISYVGAQDDARVLAFAGKVDLDVLARSRGSLVARLPSSLPPGPVKLRIVESSERSKAYTLTLKAPDFRKPFRNLVGGFALLIFGIGVLARGAREAADLRSAHALARVAGRGPSALGLGAVLGALVQSTTGAAAILAGLVSSSLLSVGPAATAFLGAELGAATAPLMTGLILPQGGLVAIAVGVLWLRFASDRRSTAFARLVLGAGLMAFGLQTFRPGFEPFVQDPTLLSLVGHLNTHSVANLCISAALGAALVAVFQGPAPVVVLVLVLSQTTAQWDLRTALSVLSGSGLGAAIGALVTTPAGRRCRQLATSNLLLGLGNTLLSALTVGVWARFADIVVPGVPHELASAHTTAFSSVGLHLGIAFATSQLAAACVLFPVALPLARWLERRSARSEPAPLARVGSATGVGRAELVGVVSAQRDALEPLSELARIGNRSAGRLSEHRLSEAHAALEELLLGPVLALPKTPKARELGRAAFTCMQFQRSLEGLHRQAERLLDSRISGAPSAEDPTPLSIDDERLLGEMHELLLHGVSTLLHALTAREALDLEAARAREIQMNALEARARDGLLYGVQGSSSVGSHLHTLELVDAYESAGNQLYRLAEALGESAAEFSAARVSFAP